ncbi:MAG: AAA family ATPase [Candidatus Saccharibacteria bacterium]|nr:AAA family ATPase [Candidatus Saccharibacteria bacterium]
MIIRKIVLTGGPCAGKTTAISWIVNYFTKLGWYVLVADEAATELILSGLRPDDKFKMKLFFQKALIKTQLFKEKRCDRAASSKEDIEKALIVCDRGVYDNKAYMTEDEFEECLKWIPDARKAYKSYDAVFHLVTAADGAEEFYTTTNNEARNEDLEKARLLDMKTMNAWVGQAHFRIIKNDGCTFEQKLEKLIKEVSSALGEPEPFEIDRKFLIQHPEVDYLISLPNCQRVEISQYYLPTFDGNEVRVRKRSFDGNTIYTETTKIKSDDPAKRIERERQLTEREFETSVALADYASKLTGKPYVVKKTRYCLMDREHGQYLEIDVFPDSPNKALLEVELSSSDQEVFIPDYLKLIKDVTGDTYYSNAEIAQRNNLL